MASEFQRRKVVRVFDALDADRDGLLEEADFAALGRRWAALRSSEVDGRALVTIMMGWWETLLAASDQDRDDKVTLDEVLLVVDRLPAMVDAVHGTAEAMFEAVDEDADGTISAAEYRQAIEAWTGSPTGTDEIFPRLDSDGDGYLSRAEFIELWTEFWAGDNPKAPGTLVFGRVDG